jgi:hypothetical protein
MDLACACQFSWRNEKVRFTLRNDNVHREQRGTSRPTAFQSEICNSVTEGSVEKKLTREEIKRILSEGVVVSVRPNLGHEGPRPEADGSSPVKTTEHP